MKKSMKRVQKELAHSAEHEIFRPWGKKLLVMVAVAIMTAMSAQAQDWTEVGTKEALNRAIADGAHIRLTADIPLSEYLQIGNGTSQTVSLDLNGYTLSRSLNAADANGHVIEVFADGTLTLTDGSANHTGKLSGGWANNGGGICNKGTLTLNNVTIDNCKAVDGGGIKSFEGATLTITGGAITNCRSDAGGGGVVNYGTANISGCTFSDNIATTRGGAIWSNSALTVSSCSFNSNRALAIGGSEQNEGDGGALHIDGGTATLTDVTITNNTSKDAGGIYVASGATLNLGGTSTLSGNTSTEHGGGGIVNQGTINLSGTVSITGNTCKTSGGGIWSNGTLNMQDNVTITGNTREGGVAQNVFLKSGKMITMTGPFTDGAQVAVFLDAGSGKFTSGYGTHNPGTDPSIYFTADLINQRVTLSEGEAMLSSLEGTVYYIEREWDSDAKKVKATQKTVTNFQVMNNNVTTLADDTWYVVNGNVTPQRSVVTVEGTAHLIICDGAKLTASIELEIGNELHIYAQSLGSGMIDAKGGGIGPIRRGPMGDLYIHGGIINAKGNTNSAGIGTCYQTIPISEDYGSIDGGNITIYDGTVTATGGDYGAGIGGGDCRNFEYFQQHIRIYGGTVVANGGSYSAGIGNGAGMKYYEHNNNYLIEIFGGNVEAHGGKYGAGIGSGQGKTAGTLKVYGGIVKAYGGEDGAGIGSGERTSSTTSTINGGKVFVNGGKVYAYGGKYGAGIGGGQDSNGATVVVNDGYVFADGGTDAAGIGSGEKYMPGSPNGGKLTVNGGHVFADGTGWGAGIGGGEDSDGAEVIINGGIVEACAGSDAGNKGGCAIGSEDGDDHRGTLTIGDNMMVHAGQTPSSTSLFSSGERVPACWFRPYTRVEPCTHEGSTYTIYGTGNDGTHTFHCPHCIYAPTETHTFDDNHTCTVCGVNASTSTVSIYLPEKDGDSYTDGHYASVPRTQTLVTGSTFTLPAPPVTYLPSGVTFAGWRVGTPTSLNINSYWVEQNEVILTPGTSYTVNENVNLTARYTSIKLSLADAADNSEALYFNNGKKAQSVTLNGRKLWKNDTWNTLCLPFAINSFTGTPLEGATVKTLESATFNSTTGTLTLNFSENSLSAIEAGKPYIVKWTATSPNYEENPVFNNVTIDNTKHDIVAPNTTEGEESVVSFIGIYSPESIGSEDKSILYLGAENKLYYPAANMTIGAFRAYFTLNNGIKAGDVAKTRLFFGEESTGVTTPLHCREGQGGRSSWYTLDGRKLNGKPMQPGVYVNSGRKIIIK